MCYEHCKAHGFAVLRHFEDAGKSAKTVNRVQFQQAIRFCNDNHVNFFVVGDCSRFSRGDDDAIALMELEAKGTLLRSATEADVNETSVGKLMRRFRMALAAHESNLKADITKARMAGAVRMGGFPWRPPIGYKRVKQKPATLAPDTDEGRSKLVTDVFHLFLQGKTKAETLRIVTERGLRSRKGKTLTAQTIDEILRNPVYAGFTHAIDPTTGLEIRERGLHDPLVTLEVFAQVQAKLDGRAGEGAKPRPDKRTDFPLTVFVRCATCGASLRGYSTKGTIPWYDWQSATQ